MTLDPRTKLSILAVTGVSVFLNGSLPVECAFNAVPLVLLISSGNVRKAFRHGALFGVLLAVPALLVPRLPVVAGGIVYMFAVYIRKLIPCFALGSYLIATTRVSTFLAAVGRLPLPKGFTIALSVTLRYFPAMSEEWQSIRGAMALRGISSSVGALIRHPMRTMEYVYVPMLVSASKISDEITQAAITRGIDHAQRRTTLESVEFTIRDAIVALVYAGILAGMIAAPGWEAVR